MSQMEKVQKIFEAVVNYEKKVITEESAKEILGLYELNVPPYALVKKTEEAEKKAHELGFPLVA